MADNNRNQGPDQGNRSRRGFASMDPERQRQIASEGGRAAHASGNAHEFTTDEARAAGKKGGESVSRDRRHMAEIGRKGGQNSHGGGRRNKNMTSNSSDSSSGMSGSEGSENL